MTSQVTNAVRFVADLSPVGPESCPDGIVPLMLHAQPHLLVTLYGAGLQPTATFVSMYLNHTIIQAVGCTAYFCFSTCGNRNGCGRLP
jgi:hypothetical protein